MWENHDQAAAFALIKITEEASAIGQDISSLDKKELQRLRKEMQMRISGSLRFTEPSNDSRTNHH